MADSSVLTRRRAIALLGAGATATLAWPQHALARSQEQVVVIGAGVAGLTTAKALQNLGFGVVVLEAQDRLGGRVHTREVGGAAVDLGGQWLTGQNRTNPLAEYLGRQGIPVLSDAVPSHFFEAGEGWLRPSQVQRVFATMTRFIGSLPNLRNQLGPGASVEQGIEAFLDRSGFTGVDRERAQFLITTEVEADYAGSIADMSLDWYWTDSGFGGGDAFPIGGCGQYLDALAAGLDVRLNTPVTSIDHSDTGVEVHTTGGSFSGARAVVTVSLGALKSGAITFDPSLPAAKEQAIDRLDMGNLEKVIVTFDEPFWGTLDNSYFRSAVRGEFPWFKDMTPFAGTPMIIAFAGADFAVSMQNSTPEGSIERVVDILGEMTGTTPPTPTDAAVTSWAADPLVGGAYSIIPVGASPADNDALGAPAGRLHFAGEATEGEYYATMHGAMLSGLREAGRIAGRDVSVADLR